MIDQLFLLNRARNAKQFSISKIEDNGWRGKLTTLRSVDMSRRRFRIAPLRAVFLIVLVTRYKSISTGITATRSRLRPSSIVLVGRRRGTLLHLLVWNELVPRRVPARQLAPLRLVLLYVFVPRGLAVSHARLLHRKTGISLVRGGPVTLQITIPVP